MRRSPKPVSANTRSMSQNLAAAQSEEDSSYNSAQNSLASNSGSNPVNYSLSQGQFMELLGGLNTVRQQTKNTFSNCSARFSGGRNTAKVEDFIATILVYKEAENVSDSLALVSLPLLLEGYASSWWQGVKSEADNFAKAIELLRNAFSPPKPDWRIFAEISQEKQKAFESTDNFVCRKRSLFAQLTEKLTENTMLNIIYSQLLITIRDKISRDNLNSFHDLLEKAREVEMLLKENLEPVQNTIPSSEKALVRCSFCRKKNHTADVCFKKLEADRRGKAKVQENVLNCYGCGLAGYYRSNFPNCNNKNVINSPEKLDFNAIQTTVVGRDVPTVEININGLKGEAYFDTAARTSVAGYSLFQKLKEKKVEFQEVSAEIILADGISREEIVYSTIVQILIGKRFRRIRFICLPKAQGNRTLIGIDFLEQAGIVLDLAQRNWHFKDDPKAIFEFKMDKPKIKEIIPISQTSIAENNSVDNFLNWFENKSSENNGQETPNSVAATTYDYSPGGIDRIFKGSIPDNLNTDVYDWDLFPPMKRLKPHNEQSGQPKYQIMLKSFDLKLKPSEGGNLKTNEKLILNNLIEKYHSVFEETSDPIPNIEHFINTGSHSPIACAPYRISPVMKEKLKKELDEMLEKNIIQEKESPWAFPVVLIPKKNGNLRVCVDYRRLNSITTSDKYPLPRMDDLLHAAKATSFMSTVESRILANRGS